MPVKWSALMVTEALDMVEVYVNQAAEPLEQAKIVAAEARKIVNLPQYVDQHLSRLIGEIERLTGGTLRWNNEPYEGTIKAAISSVRNSIPEGLMEDERKRLASGTQLSLVV